MKKKVLIAEDEVPMSRALQLKLSKEGFEVQAALDGEEAISALEQGGIDLVLLDLMMPKKDGFEVLRFMKEKGIQVPVIVSSNLGQQDDVEKCKELGASGYFVKSDTTIAEVVAIVKERIAQPHGSGAHQKDSR